MLCELQCVKQLASNEKYYINQASPNGQSVCTKLFRTIRYIYTYINK